MFIISKLYEKIIKDIEEGIEKGIYAVGKKIPSVRELSKMYNCSINTVIKAYDTLKNNHVIYANPKSGYYIVENINKINISTSDTINFYSGNTLIGDMNIPDLKHCLNWAGDLYKNNSLDSNHTGVDSLKDTSLRYLSNFQVFTKKENLFITMGTVQTLNLLIDMNFPNNKTKILLEQPSYGHFLDNLKMLNIDIMGIERNEDGINLDKLEKIFKEEPIKFFYTIPRHHNPLGTTLKKSQRKAIAKLAAKYDVYVVEDDYFSDIYLDEKYDPIYSYSDFTHVIYLKSFSKIMPWMRVGVSVIPNNLINSFKNHIKKLDIRYYISPSLLSQATLEIYIRSNILKKHSDVITNDLKRKHEILLNKLLTLKNLGINYFIDISGFYSYIFLPDHINEDILIKELRNNKVIVGPGKRCFIDNSFYKKGIRLSISSVSTKDIINGLNIIKKCLINS